MIRKMLIAVVIATLATSVFAAVSPDEAKQLGTTRTAVARKGKRTRTAASARTAAA